MTSKFIAENYKLLQEYILERENIGFQADTYLRYIKNFAKFCITNHINDFNDEAVNLWLTRKPREGNRTYESRINKTRNFLIYLKRRGIQLSLYPCIKLKKANFVPYIYSDEEIKRYFENVDSYRTKRFYLIVFQLPVMMRILYCCGLRISELLNIKMDHIFLEDGYIDIVNTKNNTNRTIFLTDELIQLTTRYLKIIVGFNIHSEYLFFSTKGMKYSSDVLRRVHEEILGLSKIHRPEGLRPRIHDFRHTFATKALKQLIEMNISPYSALPILSAQLGHKTTAGTEYYIHLLRLTYPEMQRKLDHHFDELYNFLDEDDD